MDRMIEIQQIKLHINVRFEEAGMCREVQEKRADR